MAKVVFCTSHIDDNPQRYQDWIDYYVDFFPKDVDVWMINDGPNEKKINLKSVKLKTFDENLGRKSIFNFPGWKRSFYTALKMFSPVYEKIAHIESDCFLTKKAGNAFYYLLCKENGYYTGFCPAYNFPETSLQILDKKMIKVYLEKYSTEKSWYEEINFEEWIASFKPGYILNGDRIEGNLERFKDDHDYCSGTDLKTFLKLTSPKINML